VSFLARDDISAGDFSASDLSHMALALDLARRAEQEGEVPVGAVVATRDGEVIGRGWNCNIGQCDPSAHAEIVALREAGRQVGNHRLPGSTLYVTLEPCAMCVGAALHARVERLVFGASDPKTGALGGAYDLPGAYRHNHVMKIEQGLRAGEASELLREFFRRKR
jgi:tRNA(Arg) A34 adenosine deaminase TadA